MAGLYDRIGAINDNVRVHYFVGGIKGYATGIWTRQQILNGINSLLDIPLNAAEQADLTAIADHMDSLNAIGKLGYGNQVEAAMIAAESGIIDETAWRAALQIS